MSSIFGSFVERPTNTKYDGEDNDEKILYVLRKSAITNIHWMFVTILLILVPILINTVVVTNGLPISAQALFVGNLLWYLITFGFAFQSFTNWFFNVYIISDKKIVDVDFQGILYKNISEAPLRNIEDITSTISGTLQMIFHYGTVVVQTSAEKREFEFDNVSNPSKIRDMISDLVTKVRNGH